MTEPTAKGARSFQEVEESGIHRIRDHQSQDTRSAGTRLRALVAIASYGTGHLDLLKNIILKYQSMSLEVDVVVLSEAPKDLGSDVEVRVGLPGNDPMALPFAHKDLFAERVDRYDLFIYSEDDNDVSEAHIRAYLELTDELQSDEIAGFLRYEVYPDSTWHMDEVFGHYHWKPASVCRRGRFTIAEFTNEHAGFFILTRKQLQQAIASRGFLVAPYEGIYCIRETAATDPYTRCGFRKVICISELERFLIHHADNRYIGWHSVSLRSFKEQTATLMSICEGHHPASSLFESEPKFWHSWWQKSYYEKPSADLLAAVPAEIRTVLSVGCGWGAVEAELRQRGAKVAVLPLDSVIGGAAARRGLEVIYGKWREALKQIADRQFECVLVCNLLHLQNDLREMLGRCADRVGPGGYLVASGPNFDRAPWLMRRLLNLGQFAKLQDFDQSGIRLCGPSSLVPHVERMGFGAISVQWCDHGIDGGWLRGREVRLGKWTARNWILQARRSG